MKSDLCFFLWTHLCAFQIGVVSSMSSQHGLLVLLRHSAVVPVPVFVDCACGGCCGRPADRFLHVLCWQARAGVDLLRVLLRFGRGFLPPACRCGDMGVADATRHHTSSGITGAGAQTRAGMAPLPRSLSSAFECQPSTQQLVAAMHTSTARQHCHVGHPVMLPLQPATRFSPLHPP